MLQLDAKRRITLVAGKSESGKTTFCYRYLVSDKNLTCRFIFDAEGEAEKRFGIAAAETEEELRMAIDDGFCIFDPFKMFPSDIKAAFAWWCQWVFDNASELPGEKAVLIDEVWRYCSPNSIPEPLALLIQLGRKRGFHLMFATQRPNRLNESITNEVSELVCFGLQGENALARIESFDLSVEEIRSLPLGSFVSVNVNSGAELRGRMF